MEQTNTSSKTRLLVTTALFTALTCVATMVIQIPSPMSGYVNLGDTMVLLSAFLLGPWYGAVAAGVGSALADFLLGYSAYVPGTLLIKATMAIVAGLLYRYVSDKRGGSLLAAIPAEAVMVLGYFTYAGLLLGKGFAAAASIPGNLVQAVFGMVAATALVAVLRRNSYVRRAYPAL
ncbi:MAG: ECF transporter S component [Oscillospiraceae bacterium]